MSRKRLRVRLTQEALGGPRGAAQQLPGLVVGAPPGQQPQRERLLEQRRERPQRRRGRLERLDRLPQPPRELLAAQPASRAAP